MNLEDVYKIYNGKSPVFEEMFIKSVEKKMKEEERVKQNMAKLYK